VLGKIPFLNSLPFYENLEEGSLKTLPVVPRRMGLLSKMGQIDAGLFSLMDYFEQEDRLDLLGWCIASRDQVKSVMLFSKEGWKGLEGKKIGITDGTATSVRLLQLLLTRKYGVNARFVRLHSGVNDLSMFDAVLLIGDEALQRNKHGLDGFELVFDLAKEWYDWQKLPFVFAVWAAKKSHQSDVRESLNGRIARART
jgi:chorismate dehydratase